MRNPSRNAYRYPSSAMALSLVFILAFILPALPGQAQEQAKATKEIPVASWLGVGPFPTPLPAFAAEGKAAFSAADLLKFEPMDILTLAPREGDKLAWAGGLNTAWANLQAGEKGLELPSAGKSPETAYLAAYISVGDWTALKVNVSSAHLLQVYVDGRSVATKAASDKKPAEGPTPAAEGNASADLKLDAGRHTLLVKALRDPENAAPWTVKAGLTPTDTAPASIEASALAGDRMSLRLLLDAPRVTGVSLSDDGSLAGLAVTRTNPATSESESWLELHDAAAGRLLQTFRGGMSVSDIQWLPGRKSFSYVTREKQAGTLWLVDLERGTSEPLLADVKGLGRHTWAPDGSFIIYSLSEDPEKDPEGTRRFRNLPDRQPYWRTKSFLYKLSIPDRTRMRLTAGPVSAGLQAISPDGRTLILSREVIDMTRRPYTLTELFTLDLASLEAKPLWKGPFFSDAAWSPDGRTLLFTGGPSLFDGLGSKLPKGTIPNDYDGEAYLFDPATGKAVPLTRDFDPSVDEALWSADGKRIYLTVTEKSLRRLYRLDLSAKTFTPMICGHDIVRELQPARRAPLAVFLGSGPNDWPKAYLLDLDRDSARLLADASAADYAAVEFGRTEPWTFKSRRGVEIDGLIYLPPGFDPARTYPCIVNYYGGTSPVSRDFGGRYPHEYYAALGYVVYVLQPSGATGYGQAFSALHVNDWGIIVADEIIDGVKKFLAAHPYVDPKRLGCIGASYGGFMTMLLVTRTDLFACAISHAGISSISSYWGEGFWGYTYNGVAAAGSFPWNRPDIYVGQSPLFRADKVRTPLLLLHGAADTNVPSGESTQMFTALKLLGREVEYIQILDQDHWILDRGKRLTWTRTIMAWFDRWLKDRPAWWNDIYSINK